MSRKRKCSIEASKKISGILERPSSRQSLKMYGQTYVQNLMMDCMRHVRNNTHLVIFLEGPPGCGKTLLTKIFAKTLCRKFINVYKNTKLEDPKGCVYHIDFLYEQHIDTVLDTDVPGIFVLCCDFDILTKKIRDRVVYIKFDSYSAKELRTIIDHYATSRVKKYPSIAGYIIKNSNHGSIRLIKSILERVDTYIARVGSLENIESDILDCHQYNALISGKGSYYMYCN